MDTRPTLQQNLELECSGVIPWDTMGWAFELCITFLPPVA